MSLLRTIENREVENKEVSSGKSFTVDSMFSDKSFKYIRRKSRPRIGPYGTLDFAGNNSEVWPLDKSLEFVCLKAQNKL